MTERTRPLAVFDTNVIIAALKSRNPQSPNAELLECWLHGEFDLLYSQELRSEYVEKFQVRGVDPEASRLFLEHLAERGILVDVSPAEVNSIIAADPDDSVVTACAVKGKAAYIVTYDPHFDVLGGKYDGIEILRPLNFLRLIRGDVPPPD